MTIQDYMRAYPRVTFWILVAGLTVIHALYVALFIVN